MLNANWLKSIGSMFAYRLREKATIQLRDGLNVKRNVYSHYISNSNPVYCRLNGKIAYLKAENYNSDNEFFTISLMGGEY